MTGRQALAYLKRRNVSKADILRYNIGYCDGGVYDKMIIIPSYSHEGSLNYLVARNFNEHSPVKYKNPPMSKDVVPFELFINWSSPLVLVEGMFDALAPVISTRAHGCITARLPGVGIGRSSRRPTFH